MTKSGEVKIRASIEAATDFVNSGREICSQTIVDILAEAALLSPDQRIFFGQGAIEKLGEALTALNTATRVLNVVKDDLFPTK